jgi:DNA repair protein RecO (recombination protein O)
MVYNSDLERDAIFFMRERLYRVQAIVLKRTDVGEADRLLTLFTPDLGKIRVVAKGARKPTSRKSGHVELFTHCTLMIAKGKQFDVVTQADTIDAFIPLRNDLDRLGYAYYLAELVDRFLEEDAENRSLFELLNEALGWLGQTETEPGLLARFFELHLLHEVGYRPQLFKCVLCGKNIEPTDNFFSIDAGGAIDPGCMSPQHDKPTASGFMHDARPMSLNVLKVLRYLQTREWETVRTLRLNADVMLQVEALLQRYIVHHLERTLKSVEFLKELKRESGR